MPITEFLEKNALLYPNDVSLVEINPEVLEKRSVTWREYELIETDPSEKYRHQITWLEFDKKANRFANLLISKGIKKGDKVAILLMNGIEWLPVYFGILKTGALAVPMNYRYTADEIKYCLELAEVNTLVFGPEFIGRVEDIFEHIPDVSSLIYVGEVVPHLPKATKSLLQIQAIKLRILKSATTIMPLSIFLREQQDFQRQYFTVTKPLYHRL